MGSWEVSHNTTCLIAKPNPIFVASTEQKLIGISSQNLKINTKFWIIRSENNSFLESEYSIKLSSISHYNQSSISFS